MSHGETIPTKIQILIVDDDKKLCRLVADYLSPMGYDVASAHDGTQGLEMLLSSEFHAVILDVMMPKMDGFEMLKQLRKHSDVPVLMLTARAEETDRIVGLEMGAEDYFPKTFSSRELLARLRAVANLIRNAAKYAGNAEPVHISAEKQKDKIALIVRDAGPGVPETMLDQLFEPFFRPEASRNRDSGGVGLGLAIVKTCIETCQRTVCACNGKPNGFTVSVTLKTGL